MANRRFAKEQPRSEQQKCDDLVRTYHGIVTALSVGKKAMRTNTPGVPDRFYSLPLFRTAFWWDSKSKTDTISKKQIKFIETTRKCGIYADAGTAENLREILDLISTPGVTKEFKDDFLKNTLFYKNIKVKKT